MHVLFDGPIDLTRNCRAAIITQNRFFMRNICHTKGFSDSREKRDASRKKQEMYREKGDERW